MFAILRFVLRPVAPAPILIALALLCGLGRRIAGGVLNQWFTPNGRVFGDYPARGIFGLTCAAASFAAGAPFWVALALVAAVFLGCAMPNQFRLFGLGWGGIDLGRGDHLPWWRGWAGLTAHGVMGFAVPAAGAVALHMPPFVLAGALLIGPLYALGWAIAGPWLPVGFRLGSEFGEFLWGAAIGASLILTVHGG